MPAANLMTLINIDSMLSEDERLIQKTVRDFVADKVRPHIASWFESGTSPRELARELGALGLLGMHLSGYGCAGTSAIAYGLACLAQMHGVPFDVAAPWSTVDLDCATGKDIPIERRITSLAKR